MTISTAPAATPTSNIASAVHPPHRRRRAGLNGSRWVAAAFAAPLVVYLIAFYAYPSLLKIARCSLAAFILRSKRDLSSINDSAAAGVSLAAAALCMST
ncbi:hypothetical protein [Glaciibacter superstes]|uniref:hypothetical protein n=1 Tax=Glaciibacter superstes TaxID=501023 RepID=UPI0003B61F3C|nr:hypothetical protein [Glaciibacter superstes]